MPFTIPNLITWLRILLIPLFVSVLYLPVQVISSRDADILAAGIFIFAGITDWLDGYLARALKQTSAFGAFLDPVADKLMVAAALIVLVKLNRADSIVAIIIIGREIAISALREWMAKIGKSRSVAVSMVGKIKTTAQMIAIPFLLYADTLWPGVNSMDIGFWLIWIAAILTLVSMFFYLKMALPHVTDPVAGDGGGA